MLPMLERIVTTEFVNCVLNMFAIVELESGAESEMGVGGGCELSREF